MQSTSSGYYDEFEFECHFVVVSLCTSAMICKCIHSSRIWNLLKILHSEFWDWILPMWKVKQISSICIRSKWRWCKKWWFRDCQNSLFKDCTSKRVSLAGIFLSTNPISNMFSLGPSNDRTQSRVWKFSLSFLQHPFIFW